MEKISTKLFNPTSSNVRYVIHQGGTRAGKTYTIVYYLLLYAIYKDGASISIVSESLPHLKRGVIRDIKQIIAKNGWLFTFTENKTDHIFTAENGSFIECFAADADTKLRGAKRDILFINECNNVSYQAFQELDVRTRKKTILDYNPVNRFWVHDELMPMLDAERSRSMDTERSRIMDAERSRSMDAEAVSTTLNHPYLFIKSNYKDNLYLSDAEIKNIERRQSNANWWRVYGEGETGVYEGNVFVNWETIDEAHPAFGGVVSTTLNHQSDTPNHRPDTERSRSVLSNSAVSTTLNYLPGKLIGYGVDFGFVHSPTAVVQVNEYEGEYYVKELFYNTGTRNDELWNSIKDKIDVYAQAVADCSEPKTIADLKFKGWKGLRESIKGPDSVKFGLNLLLERKIYVSNDSLNLITEFRNYIWDRDKNGKNLDVPIKEYDHGIDAIRYVVSYPKKKVLCIA